MQVHFIFYYMKKKKGPKSGTKYHGTNPYHFGMIMAAARRKKGYTQAELAEIVGTTRRAISYYEREAKNPTYDTLKRIADALDVQITRFINPQDKELPEEQEDRNLNKRFEAAKKLPPDARDQLKKLIDTMLKAHNIPLTDK